MEGRRGEDLIKMVINSNISRSNNKKTETKKINKDLTNKGQEFF